MEEFKEATKLYFEKPLQCRAKEIKSLNDLIKEWESSRKQAVMQKKKLNQQKEVLFESKMMNRWKIASGCQYTAMQLLGNKQLAFKVMLPEETKDVIKHKETYGYYSNKMKEEFRRLCDKRKRKYSQRLKGLAQVINKIIDKVFYVRKCRHKN